MPLYDFRCAKCQHIFERLQKVSDPAPACPDCKGPTERQIGRAGFRLAGTGWYETDFKTGHNKRNLK